LIHQLLGSQEIRPQTFKKCHDLAEKARQLGYQGLQAPSAALKGEKNLVIYVDGISGNLDLKAGNVRIPLNY